MKLPSRIYPLSEKALVVEWEQRIDPAIASCVRQLQQYLTLHPFAGLEEMVPAYASLTVFYDPLLVKENTTQTAAAWVEKYLLQRLQTIEDLPSDTRARRVEIPVCYGGEYGPDLAAVAAHCGMPEAEIIRLHSSAIYQVYLLGFVPGFAYMGGLPAPLATPRKTTPRQDVPAGSVGIAGMQTGIYPMKITGGWQIIGRTPLHLFRIDRQPPALLQAGDKIVFIPVTDFIPAAS